MQLLSSHDCFLNFSHYICLLSVTVYLTISSGAVPDDCSLYSLNLKT